ncbi:MAG: class I SAM-dependent RNA methyltransferase [Oscillospiraceae bacterium]
MRFDFVAPCYFGLEAAAAFDFRRLGAKDIQVTDGRIRFSGDEGVLADANLWSRCAERILILLGSFAANTFDELFDGVTALPWEAYIPRDGQFPVKGSSLSSTLSSVPACQSIVKKAVVERLRRGHKVQFLPERGERYRIRFSIRKNQAEVFLDTSGPGLHKRGYRPAAGAAPLKETLAAAMADFGRVRRGSCVQDPFCGSGTLVIESALKALNLAPGLRRRFAAEHYAFLPAGLFDAAREKARAEAKPDAGFEGLGRDIDPAVLALAKENARRAGVAGCCRFEMGDVADFAADAQAIVLTNPPYGERILSADEAAALAAKLGGALARHPAKAAYVISSDDAFEAHFGRRVQKRRKVYNGMIPCQIYMYY